MAGSRKLGKATAEKTRMEVTSLKRQFWILSALPGMTIPTLRNVVLQLWSGGGGGHVRRLLRKQAGLISASLIVVRASVSLRPSPYLAPSGLSYGGTFRHNIGSEIAGHSRAEPISTIDPSKEIKVY
jgi:hypothetical protein